jgi:hypothetical protein
MPATKDQLFSEVENTGGASDFTWTGRNVASGGRWVYAIFIGDGPAARQPDSITGSTLGAFDHVVTALNTPQEVMVSVWRKWSSGALTAEVLTQVDPVTASYNRRYFLFLTVQGSESSATGNSAASAAGASGGDPSISVTPSAADSYLFAALNYREGGAGDQAVTGGATSEYAAATGSFAFSAQAASRASTGTGSHSIAWAGDDATGNWQAAIFEVPAAAGAGGGDLSALIGEPITGSSVLN